MIALVRSRTAVTMGLVAAFAVALSSLFGGLAYAILSGAGAGHASRGLLLASPWAYFTGALAVLVAIFLVGWQELLERRWTHVWELCAAAFSTLLVAVGALVSAAAGFKPANAANVVAALGLGGWAVLLLVGAARVALAERAAGAPQREAVLWLGASGALVFLAVAQGLPEPSLSAATLAIATAVIWAVGFGALAIVLGASYIRGLITSKVLPWLVLGLWILVASELVSAVASGLVFGPHPTLLSVRLGLSIPSFVGVVGWLVVAVAAWVRVGHLLPAASPAWQEPGPPSAWITPVPSSTPGWWQRCAGCGAPVVPESRFCPQCGRPVSPWTPTQPPQAPPI